MKNRRPLVTGLAALALAVAGCAKKPDPSLSREAVTAALNAEAQSLKADGEKMDPRLGVSAVWNVQSVDVQEQPGNAAQPWRGTIKFKIDSKTKEWDGSFIKHDFEKSFNYAYDAAAKRWLMR
ncbi:MAG TPA: hypothetical protein VII13_08040 [Vicinamibacteria bacterium]|jgi:hypothetical protein